MGDLATARHFFDRGLQIATATGANRLHWQILAALAEVEGREGSAVSAGDPLAEARTLLEHILDSIPAGELRTSFVVLPEVKQLLTNKVGIT
ncbi:MAG: hypothetical protein R3264_03520 [Anaerolineae bacterium]|nr:hypothetical protein [Anaerolineae bacterium]